MTLIGLYSHAPGSGKTTVAGMIGLLSPCAYRRLSFAEPLKKIVAGVLDDLGYDGWEWVLARKDTKLPDLLLTPRQMLQTLGTEWGRGCVHPDLWVKIAQSSQSATKLFFADNCTVTFDDMRFPNEAEMIRRCGGELWLVERPDVVYDGDHGSEGALRGIVPDRIVLNDGDRDQLQQTVANLIKELNTKEENNNEN